MAVVGQVLGAVSWLTVAQAARRLVTLATTVFLARLVAPEHFGVFNMAMTGVGLWSVMAGSGLGTALVQRSELSDDELHTAFWLGLLLAGALAAVGAACAIPMALAYRQPAVAPLVWVMMMALPLGGLDTVPSALLQRRMSFRAIAIAETVATAAGAAAGVAVAWRRHDAWALAAQAITTNLTSTAGLWLASRFRPRFRFSVPAMKGLLAFTSSVWGGAVINYCARNVDNALVGGLLGARSLGFYAMAYNLVMLPGAAVTGAVNRALYPALARLQDDPTAMRRSYLTLVRILSLVGLPLSVGLCAAAPEVVLVVYGPAWAPVAPLLRILGIVGALETLNTSGILFYVRGRPGLLTGVTAASFALMTIAFAIAGHFGVTAVAWAYVALIPVWSLTPHWLGYRLIDLPFTGWLRAIAPGASCAALMALVVVQPWSAWWPLPPTPWNLLLLKVAVGAVSYCALVAALVLLRTRRLDPRPWLSR